MGQTIDDEEIEFWVKAAADVVIENGIVYWRLRSGKRLFILAATPAVLLESIRRSCKAYNGFVAETGARQKKLNWKELVPKH